MNTISQASKMKLDEQHNSLKSEAQHIIKHKFPQKILELNELLKTPQFDLTYDIANQKDLELPVPDAHAKSDDVACKGGDYCHHPVLFPNGPIDINSKMNELFAKLTPHLNDTIADSLRVQIGLQLLVPKVEDGHNTGVEIQDKALEMITKHMNNARASFSEYVKELKTRGSFIVEAVKYPHSMDFRQALKCFEEEKRVYIVIRTHWLLMSYERIYNYFIKNWDKIFNPRSSSGHESMF